MPSLPKITVFGAGKVGSTTAQLALIHGLGDVVLFNRTLEKAQGVALDLMHAARSQGYQNTISATNRYEDTKNSDIVIITAGLPRKEGMTRDQLLQANAGVVKDIASQAAKYSKQAFFIVITNPLDAMAYVAFKAGKLKREQIVGMAGTLDSSRFAYYISQELHVPLSSVNALVLGSHGDLMVPLISQTTVKGRPLEKLLPSAIINTLVYRTQNAGAEIIKLNGDSAFYAPAASVIQVARAALQKKKTTLPCSVFLKGEYGIHDTFMGVPIALANRRVQRVVELKLADDERIALEKSAAATKQLIDRLEL